MFSSRSQQVVDFDQPVVQNAPPPCDEINERARKMSIKKVVLAVSFLLLLTSSFTVMAQTQVFAFPENGTDTITVDSDPYWWHVGDYAEGQRSLAQPAFSGTLNLVFPENGLNTNCSPGNWVDLEFYIDGALIRRIE